MSEIEIVETIFRNFKRNKLEEKYKFFFIFNHMKQKRRIEEKNNKPTICWIYESKDISKRIVERRGKWKKRNNIDESLMLKKLLVNDSKMFSQKIQKWLENMISLNIDKINIEKYYPIK